MVEEKGTTNNQQSAATGDAPKRKRNRNKKKKNGTNGEASSHQQQQQDRAKGGERIDQIKGSLNPHLVLRNDLIGEGYTGEEVDTAMEEMWNKELLYDDYESILKYLKGGEKAFQGSSTSAGNGSRSGDKKEANKDSTFDDGEGVGVEESKEDPENEQSAPSKTMTMAEKLDMVAGFENFTDASFALTEWVNKAAKPHELEEFCAAETTTALPLILKRAITESNDGQVFESQILPSAVRLMVAVLKKCNLSEMATTEARESFESVVKLAREAYLIQKMEECPEPEFADKVSAFVASRVSLAMDESKFVCAANGDTKQRKPKHEGTLPKESPPIGRHVDSGIREMLSKRGLHRAAAMKSSVAARHALNTLSSGESSHGTSREVETGKSDILAAIVSEDVRAIAQQHRERLNELKSQVEIEEPDHIKEIRETLAEYESERDSIATRIAELRQSIEKLETYDAELCAKVVDLQAEIDIDTVHRNSVNAGAMNSLQEAQKNLKFNNSVIKLVDLLKSYDDTLDKAFSGSSEYGGSANGDAASKLDAFLFKASNYFATEAECSTLLQNKIKSLEKEIRELKIEIAECQGLGMTTTVGQMEDSLKAKQESLVFDKQVLDRLPSEACEVFDNLIARLDQYKDARAENGTSPSPNQNYLLQSILSCVSRLEIPNCNRLSSFIDATTAGKSSSSGGTAAVRAISPLPNGNTHVAPKSQDSSKAPKFTWANNKESNSTQKASLLDIQQEELKSKSSL